MKKWFVRVLCAAMIALGILYLLEDGFHISTIGRGELDAYVPRDLWVEYPSVTSNTEKADVAVFVYRDAEEPDTYHILEFSKNLLFDRFALTEVYKWDQPEEIYYTVVSSPLHKYAYSVDIEHETVTIGKGSPNDLLPHFLLNAALCTAVSLIAWKKREKV